MQELCSYADLLRHSSSFIEHFARTFLAGCVKAIKLSLRGNPSDGKVAPIVDLQRFRYGDDCRFSVQGFCQSNSMLNAFSRDIRSIRAHENIGVHSGAPLLVVLISNDAGAPSVTIVELTKLIQKWLRSKVGTDEHLRAFIFTVS